MNLQRLIPLVIFTISSFMLWDAWQAHQHPVQTKPVAGSSVPSPVSGLGTTPTPTGQAKAPPAMTATAVDSEGLRHGNRVQVRTDVLQAEIDTDGADLRDLKLLKHLSAEDSKKPVDLLEDHGSLIYVVQSGLLGQGLPNHTTPFTADGSQATLQPGQDTLDVRLKAEVPGVAEVSKIYRFKRGSYVVNVETVVKNLGTAPMSPEAYYQFLRVSKAPPGDPRFVSTYTGPAVYTAESKFQKVPFKDIDKGKKDFPSTANNGWIAMLQHYFVAAWLPQPGVQREFFTRKVGNDLYTAGVILPMGTIAPGASVSQTVPLYAGPQEGSKLKALAPGLDLTIDYGWLTIIATPLFYVLSWIHGWVGNWGAAIILLTVLIKAIFFPLSAASYKSMARMRVVQPKMARLREQYADDKARMNQALMELYKTEKINPLGGCLPMVVQIPVFISLYWVLLGTVELRHAPFVGWIHDLSAQDPYYILPLLMTISMFMQQRMSPKPPDPVQAKIMMFMPLAFSFMFFFFPAGLVLYWVVNNVLSIAQQWQITRMMGDGKR
ncbi:MAG: membrane protein insertase YidC [Betaproteobacteria bacterium]|nr:membrane protein insertase YidC [Betaproteobacteria bacterium]MDE2622706.1 membrane protein insertase YidC [Betaproteobacteria bacterium]